MPGSFELPVVAKSMAKSGKYDGVVCIGVVVSPAAAGGSPSWHLPLCPPCDPCSLPSATSCWPPVSPLPFAPLAWAPCPHPWPPLPMRQVRGATAHYDAVVGGATSGVLGASTDSGVPVIFGVLTCDTMEQVRGRLAGKGRKAWRRRW